MTASPFKTRYHLILFARQSETKAVHPKANVGLQVSQTFCRCTRRANGILTVNDARLLSSVELVHRVDLGSLLFPLPVEWTIRKMLAKAFIDADKCKFLARYVCNFVRYAAIEAGKQRAAELELYLSVNIHAVLEYDQAGEIVSHGKDVGEEGGPCLPCSPPLQTDEEYFPRSCAICLNDFSFSYGEEVAALPCSHVFHRDCIRQWTARSRRCPMCRDSVLCV